MSVSGFKINGVTKKYNYADLDNIDVQTSHIHDDAVTRNKIADGEVIGNKIAEAAITRNKIADGAIGNDEIENGAVSATKLGSDVINVLDNKANVDGAYEQMTVGNAEQLVSTVGVTDNSPYNFRTSGGSIDIGDRETGTIIGGTIAWNQQMQEMSSTYYATDGSSTVSISDDVATVIPSARYGGIKAKSNNYPSNINGHKMLAVASVKSESMRIIFSLNGIIRSPSLFTPSQDWQTIYLLISADSTENKSFRLRVNDTSDFSAFYVKNCMVFDLTVLLGSTIADYAYTLESGTAGAGIAWLKKYGYFTKPYYPYAAASLQSVATIAHKTVGFNQWDEEWEVGGLPNGVPDSTVNKIRSKNYCRCIENTVYYGRIGGAYALTAWFYDANNNVIGSASASNRTFTTPNSACYFKLAFESGYGKTYNHDICINLHWDGERDGEYEAYEAHTYALDDVELRGVLKLDASNNLYYDGDEYAPDGTVERRYGVVDLGTLSWEKTSGKNNLFNTRTPLSTAAYGGTNSDVCKAICAKYVAASSTNTYSNETDKTVSFTSTGYCYIEDTAYTDAATFKAAMSGVYLVYKAKTPTTESADPYTNPQIVDDWGTEEYVDYGYYTGTRDVSIPVGHNTWYAANLRAKLEMSPNSPDGDGLYAVRQSGGINTYEEIIFPTELPPAPTSDGTYRFVCTVADGVATYSWESN